MQEAIVGDWPRRADAPQETLLVLRDLNRDFLELLGADGCRAARGALPAAVVRGLESLSPAQRSAAASCPYALFDLRLDQERPWTQRVEPSGGWWIAEQPAQSPPAGVSATQFVQLVLFYAWHVAAAGRLGERVLLGMAEGTMAALSTMPLNRLPALAVREAPHLTARWSACTAFWSALAGAAASPEPLVLRRVQLYGLQLAAAARLPRTAGASPP